MKAKTICPMCNKEIIEDCEGCIKGNRLVHLHPWTEDGKEGIPDIMDVEWTIIVGRK